MESRIGGMLGVAQHVWRQWGQGAEVQTRSELFMCAKPIWHVELHANINTFEGINANEINVQMRPEEL